MFDALTACAVTALLASYVLYPVALAILARWRGAPAWPVPAQPPRVALIIAAYNEAAVIEEKIDNSLALDYPADRLQIHVFSDGSTDGTDDKVLAREADGVQLHRFEGRLGKTHAQNSLAERLDAEVLAFSDANTMYRPSAIRALAAPFAEPSVGAVIGHRRYVGPHLAGNREGAYERFENWLKANESRLGGTIGACGAIYAVRRSDYQALPPERISDIVEPLRQLCAGKRVVYAGDAVGEEPLDNDFWREIGRKRRIVLRALNGLWAERDLLFKRPSVLLKLGLHKVLRWFTLPLMAVIAVAGPFAQSRLWQLAGVVCLLYLAVSIGLYVRALLARRGGRPLPGGALAGLMLYAFGVFLSAALAVGDFLAGRNIVVWESRQ